MSSEVSRRRIRYNAAASAQEASRTPFTLIAPAIRSQRRAYATSRWADPSQEPRTRSGGDSSIQKPKISAYETPTRLRGFTPAPFDDIDDDVNISKGVDLEVDDLRKEVKQRETSKEQAMPSRPAMRLVPRTGRTVYVGAKRDFAKSLKTLGRQVQQNRIRQDFQSQRFHERPGLKRKRLKSERWQRRFKQGFKATVVRVKELAKQESLIHALIVMFFAFSWASEAIDDDVEQGQHGNLNATASAAPKLSKAGLSPKFHRDPYSGVDGRPSPQSKPYQVAKVPTETRSPDLYKKFRDVAGEIRSPLRGESRKANRSMSAQVPAPYPSAEPRNDIRGRLFYRFDADRKVKDFEDRLGLLNEQCMRIQREMMETGSLQHHLDKGLLKSVEEVARQSKVSERDVTANNATLRKELETARVRIRWLEDQKHGDHKAFKDEIRKEAGFRIAQLQSQLDQERIEREEEQVRRKRDRKELEDKHRFNWAEKAALYERQIEELRRELDQAKAKRDEYADKLLAAEAGPVEKLQGAEEEIGRLRAALDVAHLETAQLRERYERQAQKANEELKEIIGARMEVLERRLSHHEATVENMRSLEEALDGLEEELGGGDRLGDGSQTEDLEQGTDEQERPQPVESQVRELEVATDFWEGDSGDEQSVASWSEDGMSSVRSVEDFDEELEGVALTDSEIEEILREY